MPETPNRYVIPLGVAPALPPPGDENTYLAVGTADRYWLVDCAGSPIQRLRLAGLDPLRAQGVIITHFHPDHVYGLPAFVLGLFLLVHNAGLPAPLPIYARPEVLVLVRKLMALYQDQGWLEKIALTFQEIPVETLAPVVATPDFTIVASPTCHSIPSVALRFDAPDGCAFVYSGDTALCSHVRELSQDADLLIHEATGEGPGHADADEVGALAAAAGVGRLGLIHYVGDEAPSARMLAAASAAFDGPTFLCRSLDPIAW